MRLAIIRQGKGRGKGQECHVSAVFTISFTVPAGTRINLDRSAFTVVVHPVETVPEGRTFRFLSASVRRSCLVATRAPQTPANVAEASADAPPHSRPTTPG